MAIKWKKLCASLNNYTVFNYFLDNILSSPQNKTAAKSKRNLKIIQHPEYGEITLRKIKGSRRLNIRIAPLKGISVTLPYSSSWTEAEDFIAKRSDWIRGALAETQQQEAQQTIFKPGVEFKTKDRELVWTLLPEGSFATLRMTGISSSREARWRSNPIVKTRISKNKIHIYYSNEEALDSEANQKTIRAAIERTLKLEANQYLLPLLNHYANKHRLKLGKTSLRASRSRWGSCSSRNDISINIHLMRLPEQLQNYVLLHELAHTAEHNHSAKFWALLDKLSQAELGASAKQLDKELKDYSPQLY